LVATKPKVPVRRSVPLATLVEDLSIYPRHAVDDANVSHLVWALKSGATLPPIVVDAKSLRIVDGWHRARAYRRVLGPEGVVDVEERHYANEAALFLDSAALNATHGRKLDRIDEIRIINLAADKGITHTQIAHALNLPEERVEKLAVRIAFAEAPDNTGSLRVSLKRPAAHLAGTQITQEQADAHRRAPGVSYLLIVEQLNEGIRVGLLDPTDDRLRKALASLYGTLEMFLLDRQAA
jgi:hypothetical protein